MNAKSVNPLSLKAGPLVADFYPEELFLHDIQFNGEEALRGVYLAIRDQNWNTPRPDVSLLSQVITANSFKLYLCATWSEKAIRFVADCQLEGREGGFIRFAFKGAAQSEFLRNRLGLVVLHGSQLAGREIEVEHVDGTLEQSSVKRGQELILDKSPHFPAFDAPEATSAVDSSLNSPRSDSEKCQESTPDPLRIGLSTYALNWAWGIPGYPVEKALTFPRFLRLAKQWGYGGVQIADNAPLMGLSQDARKKLWREADELGLFVEIGGRGLMDENLQRHIEIAAEAGSPILRFVIDGPGYEPGFEEIPDILADAAQKCGEQEIILAIENHDRFEAHQFATWFDEVGSPWLGLCLDSVNSFGCGEGFRETIRTLLPYTVNFHLKDFNIRRQPHNLGLLIEGTVVGEGILPVKSVIDRLIELGKCQSVIVEHWTAPEETVEATIAKEIEWCQRSIQNMISILK